MRHLSNIIAVAVGPTLDETGLICIFGETSLICISALTGLIVHRKLDNRYLLSNIIQLAIVNYKNYSLPEIISTRQYCMLQIVF